MYFFKSYLCNLEIHVNKSFKSKAEKFLPDHMPAKILPMRTDEWSRPRKPEKRVNFDCQWIIFKCCKNVKYFLCCHPAWEFTFQQLRKIGILLIDNFFLPLRTVFETHPASSLQWWIVLVLKTIKSLQHTMAGEFHNTKSFAI